MRKCLASFRAKREAKFLYIRRLRWSNTSARRLRRPVLFFLNRNRMTRSINRHHPLGSQLKIYNWLLYAHTRGRGRENDGGAMHETTPFPVGPVRYVHNPGRADIDWRLPPNVVVVVVIIPYSPSFSSDGRRISYTHDEKKGETKHKKKGNVFRDPVNG